MSQVIAYFFRPRVGLGLRRGEGGGRPPAMAEGQHSRRARRRLPDFQRSRTDSILLRRQSFRR